jgi:transposase
MARSDELVRLFEQPAAAVHRRFEVCRAYFLEHCSARDIAQRFDLHPGTVQAIVRDFATNPALEQFFQMPRPGRKTAPKRQAVSERAAALRRQGKSLGEIHRQLAKEGHLLSESYLATLLREQGFSRLPVRSPGPRPGARARDGSEVPKVADVCALSLAPSRQLATPTAGLFLFMPLLLEARFSQAVASAGYPGTHQIPAVQAMLALLAPKLLGKRRVSHVSDLGMDEGAGLFAGLNVLPKTTYATDYSYRTERAMNERLVDELVACLPLDAPPLAFNLDFHAIPFRGERSELQNHWVPKRHRAQPAVMALVVQEASRRVLCYATANVLRSDADRMVVKFADHWQARTGHYPSCLLFDSRATTYAQLWQLTRRGVGFITIRRRGAAMLRRVRSMPTSQWQQCQITQAKGKRRTVKYLEETVRLASYDGTVRQIVFEGLGHAAPTFVLTNDLPERLTARQVIETYARRNHIEHALGEKITFFHLDCLASEVRLNVDFDLTLTVVAALLYRRLAERLKGFAEATPQTLFRKFVNTPGWIVITPHTIEVWFAKRAHNPILKEAGFDRLTDPVPWLQQKPVHLLFP